MFSQQLNKLQRINQIRYVVERSLFSRWENPSMPIGGRSERIRVLAWFPLPPETSHA